MKTVSMCSACCLCIGVVVAVVVVSVIAVVVVVVVVVVDPGGKCLTRSSCEATDCCANGQSMTSYREQLWPACT